MKTLTAVLFLLVVFSIPALADSGSYWSDFANPQPYTPHVHGGRGEHPDEHPDVVMADEFVSIVLGADGAVVNAEFTFRNEGAAQTVSMYFPLESSDTYNSYYPAARGEKLKAETTTVEEVTSGEYRFSASVNGTNLRIKVIQEKTASIRNESRADFIDDIDYYEGSSHSDTYAIYEVPFVAGETLTLSIEYQQAYSAISRGEWCQMLYLIHTGGSWKGPIGHGIVEVTAGSDFNWNGVWQYQSVSLPPATEKDGKLVWEFDELEPETQWYMAASMRVMMPWDNQPCWGIVLAESGINFRSERNNASTRVSAHPVMKDGEFFTIFERQGDWWRVEDEEGNSGWLRWRYVDPDTGKENIYATITPVKNTYHSMGLGG